MMDEMGLGIREQGSNLVSLLIKGKIPVLSERGIETRFGMASRLLGMDSSECGRGLWCPNVEICKL